MSERQLSRFVEHGTKLPVKRQGPTANESSAAAVAAHAPAALADALAQLRNAGIEPFLTFGTLLGAVREGGVIAGDHDIDLGVFADEVDADSLQRLFRAPGSRLGLTARSRLLPRRHQIILRHRPTSVLFDIVVFERQPDAVITRLSAHGKTIERRRRLFGLRRMNFLGQQVSVPDPPEIFLEETYGAGWRTPERYYHFVISSRMPVDPAQPMFRYHVFSALVGACLRGEEERLRVWAERSLARGFTSQALERAAAYGEARDK